MIVKVTPNELLRCDVSWMNTEATAALDASMACLPAARTQHAHLQALYGL